MIKYAYPIDFIREIIEKELLLAHIENNEYVGGIDQVSLFSFYEQLKNQEQVDRYVERFRELTDQANRSGLIANGVITAPENPTITNLYANMIIPLTFTTTFRSTLENRDLVVNSLNHMFERLKGKSVNVAELVGGELFYLRKIGNNKKTSGAMAIENGIYCGSNGVGDMEEPVIQITPSIQTAFERNYWYCLGTLNSITANYDAKVQAGHKIALKTSVPFYIHLTDNTYYDDVVDDISYECVELKMEENYIISVKDTNGVWQSIDFSDYSGDLDNYYICIKFPNGDNDWTDTDSTGALRYMAISKQTKTDKATRYLLDLFGEDSWDIKYIYYKKDNGKLGTAVRYEYGDADEMAEDYSPYFRDYNSSLDSDKQILNAPLVEFDLYKLSLSFDSARVETPNTLNGKEECVIAFSGSATLVDENVKLGNDLVDIVFSKKKVVKSTDYTYPTNEHHLEPLELPSGNSIATETNQLLSNKFLTNSHASSITPSLQYTFVVSENKPLIKQWFEFARYGTNNVAPNKVSPNTIYEITEIWSANGVVDKITYLGKIIESIDIENNENDVLTITIPIQIQGENN